jgi:hypothetical protein
MQLRLLLKQKRSVAGMRNVILVQAIVNRLEQTNKERVELCAQL